jgi:hypothetical protein
MRNPDLQSQHQSQPTVLRGAASAKCQVALSQFPPRSFGSGEPTASEVATTTTVSSNPIRDRAPADIRPAGGHPSRI